MFSNKFKKRLKNNFFYRQYFYLRYIRHRPLDGYPTLSEEIEFYGSLIKTKNLFFDVGANHGDKTKAFSLIAEKVIAFEPDITNFEFLSLRFQKNAKVEVVNKAVSNKVGKATFFINNPGSGLNTIDSKRQEKMQFKTSYEVLTTKLDEMIKKYGKPDFIKIDVEGHELEVLKGLSADIETIVFEANLPGAKNETLESIRIISSMSSEYSFNYGFDVGLENNRWMSKNEISEFIKNTELNYVNVYCKK